MNQSDQNPGFDTGLWRNNVVLVQLLGLSPLLAMSRSVATALGLGFATLAVLVASSVAVALLRKRTPDAVRIPLFLLLIATFTGCIELLLQAYRYPLYQALGIFVPLIAANGALLASAAASRERSLAAAARGGLLTGLGFAWVLVLLGALRELLGQGTLCRNMDLLFGPGAAAWQLQVLPDNYEFPLWVLPPGAFLLTGFLLALKNAIDLRRRAPAPPAPVPTPSAKRVRVTEVTR
ncbi:MAG: electron transport complex subunit RsxE [Gammaproteobacteria bacterium]|nr:electron transport complex subunit RsxE [Gammaproteobacteria bacterium]